MRLRLTVIAGAGRPAVDVEVVAPAGAQWSSVLPLICRVAGAPAGAATGYAGDHPVAGDAVLGQPPLIEAAIVSLGRPLAGVPPRRGLLELRVVGGPDAGGVHLLPAGAGAVQLGRGPAADIRLDDPDVSRAHACIAVGPQGATVADLGSTNGTTIEGRPVGRSPQPLPPGALLRVGESTLFLTGPDDPPAVARPDGLGHLEVNVPPRLTPPAPDVTVPLPAEPVRPDRPRFPVLATVLPLALGAALVLLTGSWAFALFMLLSPAMLAANALSDRFRGGKGFRAARAAYEGKLAAAWVQVAAGLAAEAAFRRRQALDPSALLLTALGPRPRLWERRRGDDDALVLRLGTADVPARLTVLLDSPGQVASHPTVRSLPVTVSLREAGVLGLAGAGGQVDSTRVDGLARHLIAQVAGLHSHRDLDVILLVAAGQDPGSWRWARWLPHVGPAARAEARVGLTRGQVSRRVGEVVADLDARLTVAAGTGAGGWVGRCTVLVLDGAPGLRTVPGVARLLAEGPRVGIYALALADDPLELPAECGATAVITGAVGTRLRLCQAGRAPLEGIVADLVSPAWAERFARALGPLRDATPASAGAGLPGSARLLGLLDADPPTADRILAGWPAQHGRTTALLGVGADCPFRVDLGRDGPHVLVAGTTGAGKSELLQTMVASLAVANRPDQLSFVLVDYKGGAAFAECARLPHTVGMVTDLDPYLTQRALSSLDAELKRRERVLEGAGCKDIEDYLRAGAPVGPVPRLVIVIDEFAALAAELPDFVSGLVDLARRGRSLGIHLVLATQRPGGVVSPEIRANTALRIALRVTDPADSADVIDSALAAQIPRDCPGRGYCRTEAGGIVQFQTAWTGGRQARTTQAERAVRRLPWEAAGDPRGAAPASSDADGPTDLARLVTAIRQAADRLPPAGIASPWLPPLPQVLTLDQLPPGDADLLPLGRCDRPAEQAQPTFGLDLAAGGHLLVAGGPRSGRTTLLRTLAGAVAAGTEPADVHLYALDCAGGGLAPLAEMPHAGAVVGREDVERGCRLISRLEGEVSRRQRLLAELGFASLPEQRAGVPAGERLPWLLLLIDGWEGFRTGYDPLDGGQPVETLLRVLRDGTAVGLRAVVAGDRSALTGPLSSLMPRRLVLRMADPVDYSLAGLHPRQVPPSPRPGQGLIPGEPAVEVQVALLCSDPGGAAQVAALRDAAADATRRAAGQPRRTSPFRVAALPHQVSFATVAGQATGQDKPLWTLLGIGGDEASPVGLDLTAGGGALLVAGPPRSGRSTALVCAARWHAERGTAVAVVTPRPSPLRQLTGVVGTFGPADADRLRAAAVAVRDRPLVVVVDDAESLLDSPVEHVLSELLRGQDERPDERPVGLVLAGCTDELASIYRGISVEVRRGRVGLVLNPCGPLDGDLFGAKLPRGLPARPGAGVLCRRGEITPVQVAC
ncbi:MAG: FtsK/SpoIIIE domain-containing protein [Actinomycetota bacterium]|nr:FtsK/SpoIIIE domain-containing protein [Actinomycetota bacterium]